MIHRDSLWQILWFLPTQRKKQIAREKCQDRQNFLGREKDRFQEMQESRLDVEPSKAVGRMKNLHVSPNAVAKRRAGSVWDLPGH